MIRVNAPSQALDLSVPSLGRGSSAAPQPAEARSTAGRPGPEDLESTMLAAQARDDDAFAALYSALHERLKAATNGLQPFDREDVVQEAWVMFLDPSFARYRAGGSPWGYLHGLLKNATAKVTGSRRESVIEQVDLEEVGAGQEAPDVTGQEVETREAVEALGGLCEAPLFCAFREVLAEGGTQEEVAAPLGLSRATFGRRLQLFRERAAAMFPEYVASCAA